MSTNVYEFRHSISNARTEFMSVEESAAAQWMWGAGTSETFV